jgi:hypothetical protein
MSSPITETTYSVHGIAEMAPRPAKAAAATGEAVSGEAKEGHPLFGQDGFTFSDFLDIINPLQHIPIVNTVYRAITGDKIDPGSRIVGGGLFGGPIGLVASLVSGMVEESTGKDPGEHALAALGIDLGPGNKDLPETALAAAEQPKAALANASAVQQAGTEGQPAAQDMKLGVTMDERAGRKSAEAARGQPVASNSGGAIELPADLFQALKQTAASQQADTVATAINNTRANPLPGQSPQPHAAGPMQVNAAPNNPVQGSDGRTWFPAFPAGGGGVPTRAVGTTPVNQSSVAAKFGVTKGNAYAPSPQAATASAATTLQAEQQSEWSNRAADAYQKYFEMQNEKNRRAGIVP